MTKSASDVVAPLSSGQAVIGQKRSDAPHDRCGSLSTLGAPLVVLILLACLPAADSAVANIDHKSWESLLAGSKVCGDSNHRASCLVTLASSETDALIEDGLPLYISEARKTSLDLLPYAKEHNYALPAHNQFATNALASADARDAGLVLLIDSTSATAISCGARYCACSKIRACATWTQPASGISQGSTVEGQTT